MSNTIYIRTNPEHIVTAETGDLFYRNGEEFTLIKDKDQSWTKLNYTARNFFGKYKNPIYSGRAILLEYTKETWIKLSDESNIGWQFVAGESPLVDNTPSFSPIVALYMASISGEQDIHTAPLNSVDINGITNYSLVNNDGRKYLVQLRNTGNADLVVSSVNYSDTPDATFLHFLPDGVTFPYTLSSYGTLDVIVHALNSSVCTTTSSVSFTTNANVATASYNIGLKWNAQIDYTSQFGTISWADPYTWEVTPASVHTDGINDFFTFNTSTSASVNLDIRISKEMFDNSIQEDFSSIPNTNAPFELVYPKDTVRSIIINPDGNAIDTDQGNQGTGFCRIGRFTPCDQDPVIFPEYKDVGYAVNNYIYAGVYGAGRGADFGIQTHWSASYRLTNIGRTDLVISDINLDDVPGFDRGEITYSITPMTFPITVIPNGSMTFDIGVERPTGSAWTTHARIQVASNNRDGDFGMYFEISWPDLTTT